MARPNANKPGARGGAAPSCRACAHYYITWEPSHPHGCRALSFKSQYLPSVEVRRNSGSECRYFDPKKRG
ncbi:MAG: uracil-DNA glycosylase [Deltaproteobacteria bacterium]|jgi:hypothetical protein|nr:uracil-DNA glycosylase [Deltaproteobacteria bacterium]